MNDRLMILYRDFPAPLRPLIESDVASMIRFAPGWLLNLSVSYRDEGSSDNTICDVNVTFAYRYATVRVYPGYFGLPDQASRRSAMRHEFVHLHLNPPFDYAIRELKRLMGDDAPKYLASVKEELSALFEGAVEDISRQMSPTIEPSATVRFVKAEGVKQPPARKRRRR